MSYFLLGSQLISVVPLLHQLLFLPEQPLQPTSLTSSPLFEGMPVVVHLGLFPGQTGIGAGQILFPPRHRAGRVDPSHSFAHQFQPFEDGFSLGH